MVKVNKIILLSFFMALLTGCSEQRADVKTVGIIVPIEHTAMNQIIAGFRAALEKEYKKPVTIKIDNAQNDMNLQSAIIQKMKNAHYDVIVPIGTGATQMAVSMAPNVAIVSLASNVSDHDRAQLKRCRLAIVHDEIPSIQSLRFIKQAYPTITNLMLIHSAADKVLPEVEAAVKAAQSVGITLHHRMVTSLSELYAVAQSLPEGTNGIFILKDNLIASGASSLSLIAQKKHIPFIASDEGSVASGADLALGVKEREIGVAGGVLTAKVLADHDPCALPITEMTALSVFINPSHQIVIDNQQAIQHAAAAFHYQLVPVNNK